MKKILIQFCEPAEGREMGRFLAAKIQVPGDLRATTTPVPPLEMCDREARVASAAWSKMELASAGFRLFMLHNSIDVAPKVSGLSAFRRVVGAPQAGYL